MLYDVYNALNKIEETLLKEDMEEVRETNENVMNKILHQLNSRPTASDFVFKYVLLFF